MKKLLCVVCVLSFVGSASGQTGLRVSFDLQEINIVLIDKVGEDGKITVKESFRVGKRGRTSSNLTEGYFLAWRIEARRNAAPAKAFFRVKISEIKKGGKPADLQADPAVTSKLKQDQYQALSRPNGAGTATMRSISGVIKIQAATKPNNKELLRLAQAVNHVKQIAIAFHNYHETYKRFPPSVVYGPDGKPWHSWRTLLLPFLEQNPLYERYRWDEPWNGPNNKKLLSKIPAIYKDPRYHDKPTIYTNVVAITGKGMMFPLKGATFNGGNKPCPLRVNGADGGWKRFRDVRDGTAFSLIIGTTPSDKNIPWTKPDDIVIGKTVQLGKPGGFGAPYRTPDGPAGVFVRGDGSPVVVSPKIKPADLYSWCTIAGGEVMGGRNLRILPYANNQATKGPSGVELVKTENGFLARYYFAQPRRVARPPVADKAADKPER